MRFCPISLSQTAFVAEATATWRNISGSAAEEPALCGACP